MDCIGFCSLCGRAIYGEEGKDISRGEVYCADCLIEMQIKEFEEDMET